MVHSTVFPVWFNTSVFHSQNQLDIKNVANLSYSLGDTPSLHQILEIIHYKIKLK